MNDVPTPQIIRSARRTASIQITPNGELIVKAPLRVSDSYIQKFIDEKRNWILKSIEKTQKRKTVKRIYAEGEEFLYLGNTYKLRVGDFTEINVTDTLNFPGFLQFRIEKELTDWYIKQAKEKITQRVVYHAVQMDAQYKNIMFSDTKSKWGTCGPDNSLQFNWKLIMAPFIVLDYVVIHELSHIREKNHSAKFWKLVAKYAPAYKQHRKWLNNNAHLLTV